MPVKIRTGDLKYKNSSGQYVGIGAIGPGSIIDDTAGSGDTNKTWSADKLESELAANGKDVFLVTITSEEVSGETVYHADKTFAQIKEAALAGMEVIAVESFSDDEADYHIYYRIVYAATSNDYPNTEVIYFASNTSGESWIYMFYPNGNIERITENVIDDESGSEDFDRTWSADKLASKFSVLEPAATSSDVGKFLKAKTVSNGKVTEYEFGEGGSENVAFDKAPVIVNSVSGPIASFDDGADMPVRDCVVSIEPVQDLHGQDSPYPAGEGTNKIAWNDGIDFTLNNVRYYVSGGKLYLDGTSTGETSSLDNTFKTYLSFTLPAGTYYFTKGSYSNPVACLVHDVNGTSTRRVSNSGPFTLTEAETVWVGFSISDNKTFNNTEAPIQIVSGSSAPTAYSPYSNICPITGWAGANLSVVGKNLFDTMAYTPSNMAFEINSGTITRSAIRIDLLEGTYTLSGNATQVSPYIYYAIESSDGSYVSGDMLSTNTGQWSNKTVTLNTGEYIILFKANSNGILVLNDVLLQIEVGTEKTVYEPYNGHEYHVSWGTEAGTIYGGSLDATTGELTVTHDIIDLGTLTWNKSNLSWYYESNSFAGANDAYGEHLLCSHYKGGDAYAGNTDNVISTRVGAYKRIWICDKTKNSLTTSEFKTAMSGVQLVYELAEPLTYQLTPVQILTLLGQNNIWADCGDISVDYCADTKTYVDQNEGVKDVQINGTSILSNGVANVPVMSADTFGTAKLGANDGLYGLSTSVLGYQGVLMIVGADDSRIKSGGSSRKPIVPSNQHTSVFYGLAKASGDTSQASSSNAVGTYTDDAKSKISEMLNAPETVSGTTPSITAKAGVRYICGECSTLTIVTPASGCIDVTFTSGTTPTVLTVTSAKANTTIKWANGFDPTSLDANTVYEINILDGEFGVVGSWT